MQSDCSFRIPLPEVLFLEPGGLVFPRYLRIRQLIQRSRKHVVGDRMNTKSQVKYTEECSSRNVI